MRETTSVERELCRIFEEELNLPAPSPETDLFATGALDSLSFVDLLFHLENRFDLKVSLDDLEFENFQSVERMARFILEEQGAPGAAAGDDRQDRVAKIG